MEIYGRVTKFGLRNFKAFYYLEDIDIRPLTVLVGANSSGKSSLLQSLLLLKQTLKSDSFSSRLKFDGEWTRLGSFASVISNFDLERTLEYRFTIEYEVPSKGLAHRFPHVQFSKGGMNQSTLAISEIKICFVFDADTRNVVLEELNIAIRVPTLMTAEQATVLSILNDGRNVTYQNLMLRPNLSDGSTVHGVILEKFLPKGFLVTSGNAETIPSYLPLRDGIEVYWPLWILEAMLVQRLESLGPVRSDPGPFYPVEEIPDIGLRGEKTVPYLLHHQSDKIRFATSLADDVREATLLEAIDDWLQRMNVTTRLTIEPVESIAVVAKLQSVSVPRQLVNLAQVGFGISQFLPVLVMGLKNPTEGWLLLEQPEIHLHPRLQGDLAEFLLCAARSGKTVIVETHSDHLINRLRRCIAEDETGTLSELVNILFVHPGTPDNPSSYVEPLEIDESGSIVNWPPDFLSDSANEALAILRAAQRKGNTTHV